MPTMLNVLTTLTLAGTLSAAATPAFAQNDWPSRTITLVSPYGAGGPNDVSARLLGEQLSDRLGQPVIVENRAGAGTRVANQYVANAPADGYTLLYAAAPYATLEALHGELNYNPREDLRPVAMSATVPLFLIVNADSPIHDIEDLAEYAETQPNGLTIGSPGHGSLPHLAAELLLRDADLDGLTVHYRGDVAAYTDLAAGRLDATLTAISAARPHIDNGKLRVIGVAASEPSAIYPDAVPLPDQGLPSVVAAGWYGFMAPAGVPDAIADRLDEEINLALNTPEIREKLIAQGMDPQPGSAADFQRFIDEETTKWTEVINDAGIEGE